MATHTSSGEPATSVGVGQGNDRQGESMQKDGSHSESGGSGGSQLTHSITDTHSDAPVESGNRQRDDNGSATASATPGAKNTRAEQAGPGRTGLGTPETGGNQSPGDVAPPRN